MLPAPPLATWRAITDPPTTILVLHIISTLPSIPIPSLENWFKDWLVTVAEGPPLATVRVLLLAEIDAPTVSGANAERNGESTTSPVHVTVDKR